MFANFLALFQSSSVTPTEFLFPVSFSKNVPDKISSKINVQEKKTLLNLDTTNWWRIAIADEPIDAKVDGQKSYCVRIDNAGDKTDLAIGFTPMETFASFEKGTFGLSGFTGCGCLLETGNLQIPFQNSDGQKGQKNLNIVDKEISKKAREIIVILTVSENGTKKEIRFLCDGVETKSTDVSEHLKEDFLYPAIVLSEKKSTSHNNPDRSNQNSNSRNRETHQAVSQATAKEKY